MATGKSPFARHYDKFVALICLAALAGAVYFWLSASDGAQHGRDDCDRELRGMKPDNPEVSTSGEKEGLAAFSNAFVRIARPFQISFDSAAKTGFFVPEARVWCVKCAKPIPFAAETCPLCGEKQPSKKDVSDDPSLDSDSDGLPDAWERRHALNPLDPSDAEQDADGDGFTNLEEFRAQTNPRDASHHPDLIGYLRVATIDATSLPLVFMNTSLMPDRSYKCQFNYEDRETGERVTLMCKVGDVLGPLPKLPGSPVSAPARYADFKLVELKWNERKVAFAGATKTERTPVAIVERVGTGRRIELLKETPATDTEYRVTFVQPRDGSEYVAEGSEGEAEFAIGKETFVLKKVDKSSESAVIVRKADKKEFSIPAQGKDSQAE